VAGRIGGTVGGSGSSSFTSGSANATSWAWGCGSGSKTVGSSGLGGLLCACALGLLDLIGEVGEFLVELEFEFEVVGFGLGIRFGFGVGFRFGRILRLRLGLRLRLRLRGGLRHRGGVAVLLGGGDPGAETQGGGHRQNGRRKGHT
jgi:hypothetical protein